MRGDTVQGRQQRHGDGASAALGCAAKLAQLLRVRRVDALAGYGTPFSLILPCWTLRRVGGGRPKRGDLSPCDCFVLKTSALVTRPIVLRNELEWIIGRFVNSLRLSGRQSDLLRDLLLVGNVVQQVPDQVQSRTPLVVRSHHVPWGPLRVASLEHFVTGARVVVPSAAIIPLT